MSEYINSNIIKYQIDISKAILSLRGIDPNIDEAKILYNLALEILRETNILTIKFKETDLIQ